MSTLTVQQARDAFDLRKRDITDVSATLFATWCDYLNKFAYRQLYIAEPERYVSTQSYTISSYPQTSALPASFDNIAPLGTGFFVQNSDGSASSQTLARTGYGSSVPGFYITGSNVVFTGMQNQTIVLRYIPTQTTLTTVTDYFSTTALTGGATIIDSDYTLYLVNALDVLYTIWDVEAIDESYADQRFVRALNEMVTTMRKEVTAFAIDDYTLSF